MTVAELGDLYLEQYAARHHKDGGHEARRKLEKNIVPTIGRLLVEEVTRADIERVHRTLSDRAPTQANRTLAQLSGMFRFAEERGIRSQSSNPCRYVKKNRETTRERYLTDEEVTAYAKGLDEAERRDPRSMLACDVLRLLLLTGARKGEILSLRWQHVDLQRAILLLPDSNSGQRNVLLPEAAVEILRRRRKTITGFDWVFPERGSTGHLTELKKTHSRACENGKGHDLKIHDLRHTFASVAVTGGHGLPVPRCAAKPQEFGKGNRSRTEIYSSTPLSAPKNGLDQATPPSCWMTRT